VVGAYAPAMSDAAETIDDIFANLWPGTNVIVPIANGEPVTLLDRLETHAEHLDGVRVHQMHALHDRPLLHGAYGDRLRHRSYFLSHITRPAFHAGTVDLVPAHFSEVPQLLEQLTGPKMVLAAVAPPDRHGYYSLGVSADYVAPFIGRVPFVVEVNHQMPRSFGGNQIHSSQVTAAIEVDRPLVEVPPKQPGPIDAAIAHHVVERIPNGATLQAGIGAIPNAVMAYLRGHRDLGVHTELLSDGIVDLVEAGVVTGIHKARRPRRIVTTFALGTRRVYDFIHENAVVDMLRVDWVNDPRIIGSEPNFVSINATTEVDLLGQCASETIAGRYWSGSGGQADFARGAMYSDGGHGFIVCQSTAESGTVSRVVSRLSPGSVVTTQKNTVDKVVTEHGVAELRGRSIRERAEALIAIAAPDFRDQLTIEARALGYL
jgi:acyl-CoA hydrolase